MATFTNKATLTYNDGAVDSNTVTGELLEVLSLTKTAETEKDSLILASIESIPAL